MGGGEPGWGGSFVGRELTCESERMRGREGGVHSRPGREGGALFSLYLAVFANWTVLYRKQLISE